MISEKDVPMRTLLPLRVSWRALLWACLFPALASCDGDGDGGPMGPGPTAATVEITSGPTSLRQGDVVVYTVEMRDSEGVMVSDPTLSWRVSPHAAGICGSYSTT